MNNTRRNGDYLNQLELYKEIAQTLNRGFDLSVTLHEVLSQVLQITGFTSGWIFLENQEGKMELAADCRLPPALSEEDKASMCSEDCYCIERYKDGRLKTALNVVECKRLEEAIEKRKDTYGLTHHASVALRSGNEFFGILNIADAGELFFGKAELQQLEAIALQIGNTIKRILLTEHQRMDAIRQERIRLSSDLHDSVNQLLFSINLLAKSGQYMSDIPSLTDAMADIQMIAQKAQLEMKEIIWRLRKQGLEKDLVSHLEHYAGLLGIRMESEVKGRSALPFEVEHQLLRIGQEAINNVKKHAQTDVVKFSLLFTESEIKMEIKDSGCGFIVTEIAPAYSLGLENMGSRAGILNGECRIISQQGSGTAVSVTIPLKGSGNE
ncbi:GAF domain-containing sensor histidine kinase [Bacillus testis]|uniref:GAF domain-containing sensor histidine kinase n=1 Tax=Bacillus testis TaxID=1622072 RepID=UPI00067E9812|nr:GAF domain-containing sensor histidine kinase [Bacillus testis]